jgi:hypothetical protein
MWMERRTNQPESEITAREGNRDETREQAGSTRCTIRGSKANCVADPQRVDMREGQVADVLGEAKVVIGRHGEKMMKGKLRPEPH